MKTVHPQNERLPALPIHVAMTVNPSYEDEVHQDRMRRLHNARASQRAARYHRIHRAASI